MLTTRATEWLEQICDAIPTDGYKMREWKELYALLPDLSAEEGAALWRELRAGGMVQVKFHDDDEVCFALSERSRAVVQDVKILRESHADPDQAIIQTGADGKAMMMVSTDTIARDVIRRTRKTRNLRSWIAGLLSGIVGGIVGGIVVAVIFHFAIG